MTHDNNIRYLILNIAYFCRLENIGGFTDASKELESLTKSIFSIIDKSTFKVSAIKCNNPNIEFISDEGVEYQVTTNQNFTDKCQRTIDAFLDKKSENKLRIVYFKELNAQEQSKKEEFLSKYDFLDIIDSKDLIRLIANCSTSEISAIVKECQNFLPQKIENINFDACLQKQTVCDDFIERTFNWINHSTINIEDVFQTKNSVIIGDASTGKTELLKYINNFSVEKNRCTYFYKLKNYSGTNLKDVFPNAIYLSFNPLILLDGYDEIKHEYIDTFVSELNSLASKYPNFQIIISSRKNFCDKSFSPFDEFNFLYIEDINDKEISNYFNNKLGADGDKYKELCKTLNVYDLLRNPFYLTRIVGAIKTNSNITNRSELMDFIFNNDYEKFKFAKNIDKQNLLDKLMSLAEFLVSHKTMSVPKEMYLDIDENFYKDFAWLLFEDGNISFVHNNFKEYLMAKKLSTYPFKKLKNIISVKLDKLYIKPEYVNILSFLLSVSNNKKLLKYILDYGKHIILGLETSSLSPEEKYRIVTKVYDEYEKKRSWPNASFYRSDSLAKICDTKPIIEFLISKINVINHRTTIVYTLEVLKCINCWFGYKSVLERNIYEILKSGIEDATTLSNLIYFWAKLNAPIEDACNIYLKYNKHERSSVRAASNYLLKEYRLGNKFVEEILNSIPNTIPIARVFGEKEQDIIDIGENMYLEQAIELIDDKNAILKLLDYLIENEKSYTPHFLTEHIFNALKNIKIIDNEIIEKIYDLYKRVELYDSNNVKNYIIEWLLTNELIENIVNRIVDDSDLIEYKKYAMLSHLYSEKYNNLYLDIFNKKLLSDPCRMILEIKSSNGDWNALKNLLLSQGFKIKEFDENTNKNSYEEKVKETFNDIFDIIVLKNKIHEIYTKSKNELLNKSDVIDIRCKEVFEEKFPIYLCNLFDERGITETEAISQINYDWQIRSIYELLQQNKFITISNEQKEFISSWVLENVKKFNFKHSISYIDDKWSTTYNAIFCDYFIRKLDLNVDNDILKQMLCFVWQTRDENDFSQIEFIKSKIGESELKDSLKLYCENGILQGYPLQNRINYCIKNEYDILLNCVINKLSTIENTTNYHSLYDVCIQYLEKFNHLELILPYYKNFPMSLKLNVLDVFYKNENMTIVETAKKDFNGDSCYALIRALMRFGDNDALKYYINYVQRNKSLYPKDDYPYPSLKSYNKKSDFNLLFKLLPLTYKFADEENNIRNDIMYCFEKICCNSNIFTVRKFLKKINRFINYSKFKNVNYLHYYVDGIKLAYINSH